MRPSAVDLRQSAEVHQHVLEFFQIGLGQRKIHAGRRHALAQHLGDVALQVVHRLAHLPGAAVADIAGVHAVGAAGEDVGLQRDAEFPAVVDDVDVVVRNAARPDVEPQPLVELAHLRVGVHLLEHVAAPQGEAASADAARGLQDHDVVAGAVELVGRAQPGDAGAEDRDRLAGAGIVRQRQAPPPAPAGVSGNRTAPAFHRRRRRRPARPWRSAAPDASSSSDVSLC